MKERARNPEVERRFTNLDAMQEHFDLVFAERDNIYLPNRDSRIFFLGAAVGDLTRAILKELDKPTLEKCAARIVARVFCIGRSVDDILISQGLTNKYPEGGCAYCGKMPCRCKSRRDNAELEKGSIAQMKWPLRKWQEHLGKMYGEKNNRQGIHFIINRLNLERDELAELEDKAKRGQLDIDQIKWEYALELGDTMAWTIGATNYLEIDIEQAVENKYKNGCSRCGQMRCKCIPDLTNICERRKRGEE